MHVHQTQRHRRWMVVFFLTLTTVLSGSLSPAQDPAEAPNLDADLPPQAKARETNSIGMQLAILDPGVFQMGAPEYVVQVALAGNSFRSGQIFIVDDQAGNSQRFELVDNDTGKNARLYLPVKFSSGKKSNQPSSPEEIAASMAQAINAQARDGKLQITATVRGSTMHFKGIGLFSAGRVNTDNNNRVIVRKPDRYASDDERPQHRTQITESLLLGVTEVTQQQWNAVMGSNNSTAKGDYLPVNNISYDQAVAFCQKLSQLPEEMAAGRTYRLPTEAEWEYACRAGTPTFYEYGDNPGNLEDYAWYRKNADKIQVVAGKQCNQWGLFDMYGNVSEWCRDYYAAEYYGNAPPDENPPGPATGDHRVLRGGNFLSQASSCRSSYRGRAPASIESQLNGLRVVCLKK
ncbi:MAG: formylglycine-generating enzyme family protein [Planctomycetota bacterium]|nr:formylglycine-generating enzyme family protein [Planctomycetota bacterium]